MRSLRWLLAVLGLALLISGCSTLTDSRSFMHPGADFSYYQKIGVLPFANQATDQLAGEKVTEHFMTELLIEAEGLEVMDPGQFNAVSFQVTRGRSDPQMLSPSELKQIGEIAGVQGIFLGILHQYEMIGLGGEQYPVMSMTLKFIDASTGTVVWQNNTTTRGGPYLPIISVGESFLLGELTQKVCKHVVRDFFRKADF